MSTKKKARILVVDDKADILVGLSERLQKAAELVAKATVGGTIEHGDPAWQCERENSQRRQENGDWAVTENLAVLIAVNVCMIIIGIVVFITAVG